MKKQLIFLASSSSPHVRHWVQLLKLECLVPTVYSIHSENMLDGVDVYCPFSKLEKIGRIGGLLLYILLGLYIKYIFFSKDTKSFLLHAHNTSGYGLSAYLSGLPYIITTYGSEIFDYKKRGKLYQLLIKKILSKAAAITTTSKNMSESLVSIFGVNKEKIIEFSLGVSNSFYLDSVGRDKIREKYIINNNPVWIVNRRVHPLYHTIELIKAFILYRQEGGKGFIFILEGDYDLEYLNKVKRITSCDDNIILISGFMSQNNLRAYLSSADFSISAPETDQLSSSILESAVCGTIPLLADLESYAPVRDFCLLFKIPDKNDIDLYKKIFSTSSRVIMDGTYEGRQQDMLQKIEKYKMKSVLPYIRILYK